ncbi:protein-export chaperone SecB [Massilia eburnea]|uniref:protein-export chaperone SecB n=1 Tax=Massilia eburnea TaxID=1776165 RepID=UPI003D6A1ED5
MVVFFLTFRSRVLFALFGIMVSCASLASDGIAMPLPDIQRIYLKHLELKQPNSPAIFLDTAPPEISYDMTIDALPVGSDVYEVVVGMVATGRIKNKVAYTVSAKQAGIFLIKKLPEDQLHRLLGAVCPNIIYPYLRANLNDAIIRAGFAPVYLTEIDWDAYYKKEKRRKK